MNKFKSNKRSNKQLAKDILATIITICMFGVMIVSWVIAYING